MAKEKKFVLLEPPVYIFRSELYNITEQDIKLWVDKNIVDIKVDKKTTERVTKYSIWFEGFMGKKVYYKKDKFEQYYNTKEEAQKVLDEFALEENLDRVGEWKFVDDLPTMQKTRKRNKSSMKEKPLKKKFVKEKNIEDKPKKKRGRPSKKNIVED